jgi:hypothetical protein
MPVYCQCGHSILRHGTAPGLPCLAADERDLPGCRYTFDRCPCAAFHPA